MDMMEKLDLELFDCPICHGAGLVEEDATAKYIRTGILDENCEIFWKK